ncbi:MAG: hypothetical protein IKS48_10390 [Eubacterium sp.]|nr:hypothetical protein [Eubacterium sp.]
MIIDLILDRKDGEPYNPKDFYTNVLAYEDVFKFEPTISKAMDYGEEEDVKRALCDYINRQNYNPSICDYINSVNWLTSSKKVVKSAANSLPEGSDYYEWVSYDVWGNEEDGWEVNDTSRFSDKRVVIHDDLTGLEVLKVLCAEGIINRQYINDIDVEFLDDYYIELTEKDTGKPIGRLEKVQDIESSCKPIKSAVSDDKWELVDELCNRAIAEMNGDRDAMFFTRMSNGFIVKGKYIDEYESSTGITNPHKLWKKIVMVLGVDELVPITEGTFRKYYELGVKWVGMEIQNSRKVVKSSMSEELEQALADLGDAESDFELVGLVQNILNTHGMSEKYHDFCEEIDKAKSWKGMGDVAEKYIRIAIKSSRRPVKSSADNLPKEVYYMVVQGAKMYYSTDYDKVAEMVQKINSEPGPRVGGPYTEDDPDEIRELYEVGYLSNSRKPVKSSTTWVAGKSENGNKSFYCEDGKFYAEEDYGRPSIKVFNNKDDAEKIAKRSKSGFIQVLDEYDD